MGDRASGDAPIRQTETAVAVQVPLLQRILALLAAAACVLLTIGIWRSVSGQQSMWPLPGLYFVELPAVAVVTALEFLQSNPSSAMTAWISAGIFAAFSVIGAFSVGLFYLPIAIMFVMLAVLATVRQGQGFLRDILAFLIAVAVQALVMFVLTNLLVAAQAAGR
jgi:hypothetical protein